MIKLDDVSFAYSDAKREESSAIDGVALEIPDGEFTCIVGHSGCGKTTLLRLIAGLDLPRSGSVTIDRERVCGPIGDGAIVFQQYPLYPWMRVQRNVEFGILHSRAASYGDVGERASEFLRRVGMNGQERKYPSQLSGGMKQRVALARALAMDPGILLLDEPFGALDPLHRVELQALVEQLWLESSPRKHVVFVTHDIDEALLLADRVVFMESGRIRAKFEVPFDRPRRKEDVESDSRFLALRTGLLRLFYGN